MPPHFKLAICVLIYAASTALMLRYSVRMLVCWVRASHRRRPLKPLVALHPTYRAAVRGPYPRQGPHPENRASAFVLSVAPGLNTMVLTMVAAEALLRLAHARMARLAPGRAEPSRS